MDSFVRNIDAGPDVFGHKLWIMCEFITHQLIEHKDGFAAALDKSIKETNLVEAKRMKVVTSCVYSIIGDCKRVPVYGKPCHSNTCKSKGCHKAWEGGSFLKKLALRDPETFYSLFSSFAERIDYQSMMNDIEESDWTDNEGQYLDMNDLIKLIYEAQHSSESIIYTNLPRVRAVTA